jgi:hypothetical protein
MIPSATLRAALILLAGIASVRADVRKPDAAPASPESRPMAPARPERGEWDAAFLSTPGCASFATSFQAARGEVKVTRVEGPSKIPVGQTQPLPPGAFRLDQFSEAEQAFGCDVELAMHANRIEGPARGDVIQLTTVVEGKLREGRLERRGDDLVVSVVGEAEPGTRITREGVVHAIPLGFATAEEVDAFARTLSARLSTVLGRLRSGGSPLEGVQAFVIGSAVKGRSAGDPKKGKPAGVPFDGKSEPSDLDVTIVSADLFEEGRRLGCNVKESGPDSSGRTVLRLSENCEELEGRERPAATDASGHPELAKMREELTALLKPNVPEKFGGQDRPMNYVVANGRPAGAASIDLALR